MTNCPLCRNEHAHNHDDGVYRSVNCPACGWYTVADVARTVIDTLPDAMLAALSRAAQRAHEDERRLMIGVQNLPGLIAQYL